MTRMELLDRKKKEWARKQIQTVTHEMLIDRGYTTLCHMCKDDQLNRIFQTGGNMMTCMNDSTGKECQVIIMPHKMGVKMIRELQDEYNQGDVSHLVIITLQKSTSPAQKRMLDADILKWCSVFSADQVIRNVTKHKWVPKHTKLTDTEIDTLLQEWKATDTTKLPIILTTDVIARYMGFLENDVIKMEGPDGTHVGTQTQYRRVVSPM